MPDQAVGGRSDALTQRARDNTFRGRNSRSCPGAAALAVSAFMLMVGFVGCGQGSSPQQPSWDLLPQQGDKAPNFTLESSTGGKVSLSDFRKKDVLLYFSMGPG